jgi:hypothetical protein
VVHRGKMRNTCRIVVMNGKGTSRELTIEGRCIRNSLREVEYVSLDWMQLAQD